MRGFLAHPVAALRQAALTGLYQLHRFLGEQENAGIVDDERSLRFAWPQGIAQERTNHRDPANRGSGIFPRAARHAYEVRPAAIGLPNHESSTADLDADVMPFKLAA